MTLAYTTLSGRGDTDLLLSELVDRLSKDGLRVCGCVQFNPQRLGQHHCDMMIRTVPTERLYKISQNLGAGSRGCRLDVNALEAAVTDVTAAFAAGVDVLIINKFGKHEAEGRGFRDLIAESAIAGVPVLLGLNSLNRDAFLTFAGGLAVSLAPNPNTLHAWVREQCVARRKSVPYSLMNRQCDPA